MEHYFKRINVMKLIQILRKVLSIKTQLEPENTLTGSAPVCTKKQVEYRKTLKCVRKTTFEFDPELFKTFQSLPLLFHFVL